MSLLYRLGIAVVMCTLAIVAGLSVAYLSTSHVPIIQSASGGAAQPTTSLDQPSLAPTTVSTPVAQLAPTATNQAATPTLPAPSAEQIFQQVKAALAQLHSGQIDAQVNYTDTNRSSAAVTFDLGDPTGFAIATTYTGTTRSQTAERITIDSRSWQRLSSEAWVAQPAEESASGQLQAFLPRFDSITNLGISDEAELLALHWSDSSDAESVLLVDPVTHIPRQFRQLTRTTGLTVTVNYTGWNTAVQIKPPN